MTEAAFRVLLLLIEHYLDRGRPPLSHFGRPYLAHWTIAKELGIELAGVGVPTGSNAIQELLDAGLIEEVENLSHRYRIRVVKEGER